MHEEHFHAQLVASKMTPSNQIGGTFFVFNIKLVLKPQKKLQWIFSVTVVNILATLAGPFPKNGKLFSLASEQFLSQLCSRIGIIMDLQTGHLTVAGLF